MVRRDGAWLRRVSRRRVLRGCAPPHRDIRANANSLRYAYSYGNPYAYAYSRRATNGNLPGHRALP